MSVSERIKRKNSEDKITVFCCGVLLKTAYCPQCGKSMAIAEKDNKPPYPRRFTVCLHNNDSYDLLQLVEELGLTRKDKLYDKICECAYEVALEFEITSKDGQINLISVNKIPLMSQEFEKNDLVITNVGLCVITTIQNTNQIFVRRMNIEGFYNPFYNPFVSTEFEILKNDVRKHYKPIK